jgi:hypothetical protein
MKRRLYLIALIFLVCLPFISAETNETEDDSIYSIDFNIDKTRIQLGDNILITGKVYENNDLLEDQVNMKFHFISGTSQNQVYLSIFDGTFSLSPRLENLASGTYSISVELIDLNGNTLYYFNNLQDLTVDNQLILDVSLEAEQMFPGDSLNIGGSIIRNLDKKEIPLGVLTLELDGIEYVTEVSNGNLDYELVLNEDIYSGNHEIKLKVEDNFGNIGEMSTTIYIIPEQESLELILEKKEYNPLEEIYIRAALYDQASNEMIDDVKIKIFNPKGKKVLEEEISTSSSVRHILSEQALPGEWKIRVESQKIEVEKFIEVKITETLSIELVAQTLKIRNSGNIKYETPLEILAINEKHNKTLEFRTNLKPGGNLTIDLYRELKDLKYEITVLNTNETFNVDIHDGRGFMDKTGDFFKSVTGQAVHVSGSKNGNVASYGFGIIMLLLIIFSAFFFNKRPALSKKKKIIPEKFKAKSIQSSPRVLKKSTEEEEIEDFKTRILKDIEKSKVREDKKEDNKPFNVQPFFPLPKEPSSKEDKPKRISFDKPLRRE